LEFQHIRPGWVNFNTKGKSEETEEEVWAGTTGKEGMKVLLGFCSKYRMVKFREYFDEMENTVGMGEQRNWMLYSET
jgi:hypothetical protein